MELTAEQQAFLNKLADEERLCEVCLYVTEGCTGGVHGGPNGPIFPACTEKDYEYLVDLDALERLMEDELNAQEET